MLLVLIKTNADWVSAIARIVLGIVFFAHGAQKLLGWYGGHGFKNTMQTFTTYLKLPPLIAVLVILTEFFGGLGLIVGLFSRLAALGVAATMVGAVLMVHYRQGLFMNWTGDKTGHGVEYHLIAIALSLVVMVNGAGCLSLDHSLYNHMSRNNARTNLSGMIKSHEAQVAQPPLASQLPCSTGSTL
jgi:putative oxidoreductase